jgi:hypothetical protein
MATAIPSLKEMEATVTRMEERYRDHRLFADYLRLKERFDADLSDIRDRALAKSAALMLIKYESENSKG